MMDILDQELLRAQLSPEDYEACLELPESYITKMFSQEVKLSEFYHKFSTIASFYMNKVMSGDEYIITNFIENTDLNPEYVKACDHLFSDGDFKVPQRKVGDRIWDTKINQLSERSDFSEIFFMKTSKASWVLRNSRAALLLPYARNEPVTVKHLLTILAPSFALLKFHQEMT